jgi:hypothetical protein
LDVGQFVIFQSTKVFTMKSLSRIAVSALFSACGLVGISGSAFALTTEHGTICKPYGNSNTANLFSYTNGVTNGAAGAMGVICPVIRTAPAGAGGFSVWVDGSGGTGTAYCTLYSYNYTGAYLGSVSFNATGTFTRLVTLPQAQVPTYSSQAVYCSLPGGSQGRLFDIEPVQ